MYQMILQYMCFNLTCDWKTPGQNIASLLKNLNAFGPARKVLQSLAVSQTTILERGLNLLVKRLSLQCCLYNQGVN